MIVNKNNIDKFSFFCKKRQIKYKLNEFINESIFLNFIIINI